MPHYDFKKDFPIAKETEREVAGYLNALYNAEILEFGNTNKYDIRARIKGKEYTFEVKEDFIGERTGNVGLEYSCRGKPSGIETSQADYYIYKLHTQLNGIQIFMCRTTALKRSILEHKYIRTVNGGDPGSNSLNYLFKYNTFVKVGRILPLDKIKKV
jgi:hypothetical protein